MSAKDRTNDLSMTVSFARAVAFHAEFRIRRMIFQLPIPDNHQ